MTHNVQFPELGLHFQVNTVAFNIGGFSVQWYGVIIAAGFLLAILYGFRSSDKMKINKDHLFDCIIVGLICGIIGARLYYVIFYPGDKYIVNPLQIFNIKEGGLGIYGGIIGGMLGGMVVAKIHRMKIGAVLDVASLGFLIGQGIGRWGNFINQEAFGTATTLPWGMRSDMTELEVVGNVHPCFLYESILCLVGFALLHGFTRKLRRYDGQTFLLYAIWYGASRFFIEGLRTDSLMVPGMDLRISQVVAAATVLVSVIILVVFSRKTSLTGCGSKKVMELNGITFAQKDDMAVEVTESTIFKGEKVFKAGDATEEESQQAEKPADGESDAIEDAAEKLAEYEAHKDQADGGPGDE